MVKYPRLYGPDKKYNKPRKERENMSYILTTTAKRKNAKRHIVARSVNLDGLKKLAENINKRYIVELYTGNWQLIERLK